MKKIISISLLASLACLGTANAQSLSEAIENVDISGSVVYRYQDYTNDEGASSKGKYNRYKMAINLSSKVNEDVKFNTRVIAGNLTDSGLQNLNYSSQGDQALDIGLAHAYFTYTGFKNTAVSIGKQGVNTPWTKAIHLTGNEHTGTGIHTVTKLGPVSLTAAYFNQTNIDNSGDTKAEFEGASDMFTVGLATKVAFLNLDAWYMDVAGTGTKDGSEFGVNNDENGLGFDSYTFGVKASHNFDGLNLTADARYTNLTFDEKRAATGTTDNSLFDINLIAKYSIYNASIGYMKSGKDGGFVAFDQNAVNSITGWNFDFDDRRDGNGMKYTVGVKVTDPVHVSLNYFEQEYRNNADTFDVEEESLYTQITYKMSKNFSTYLRFGTYEKEEDGQKKNDDTRGRVQIAYTF